MAGKAATKTSRGGFPGARHKVELLEAEVAELRARLGSDQPMTREAWEFTPQGMRDQMAARAMFQSWGHWYNSLALLGFPVKNMTTAELHAAKDAAFDTDGVKAILEADLADAAANRKAIVERQVEIARYGNNDQSVRAVQMIAKLEHWITDEPPQTNVTIHLASLVGGVAVQNDPQAMKRVRPVEQDALPSNSIDDILGHEPGQAQRVDDETVVVE